MQHTIHVHQAKMRMGQPAIIDRTYIRSTHHKNLTIVCPHCNKDAAVIVQTTEQDACGAHITIKATKTYGDGLNSENKNISE
jgi:hypothetical protein